MNSSNFESIQLDEMNSVTLLNRNDTKFVFNENKLDDILKQLEPSYRLLNINSINRFSYENTYFDTDDFHFYMQHHNENRNRYKVRFRKYSPTNACYFEIKTKNNKNRTIKKRFKINSYQYTLGEKENRMITDLTKVSPQLLTSQLKVNFTRMTLVNKRLNERLTIDTGLNVENGTTSKMFENLVITEIKQNKYNPKSDFIQILRSLRIPEMRFSKYCMGMLHVNKNIKYNRFKPKLIQINKMLTQPQ